MDPSFVFALAIVAAPAVLTLATLAVLGTFIVGLADGSANGPLRRPA